MEKKELLDLDGEITQTTVRFSTRAKDPANNIAVLQIELALNDDCDKAAFLLAVSGQRIRFSISSVAAQE